MTQPMFANRRPTARSPLFGIDLLRRAVQLLSSCEESFNQRFTAPELVRLAECCMLADWDFYPDQWEERQVHEAITRGLIPEWKDDGVGIVAAYDNPEQKQSPSARSKHVGHDVTFGKGGPGGRCSDCHEDLTAEEGNAVREAEDRGEKL